MTDQICVFDKHLESKYDFVLNDKIGGNSGNCGVIQHCIMKNKETEESTNVVLKSLRKQQYSGFVGIDVLGLFLNRR